MPILQEIEQNRKKIRSKQDLPDNAIILAKEISVKQQNAQEIPRLNLPRIIDAIEHGMQLRTLKEQTPKIHQPKINLQLIKTIMEELESFVKYYIW